MKIELHIERLVLDGLPVSRLHAPLVRAAVERELTGLLTSGGLSHELRSGGAVPSMRAGNIQVEEGSQPGKLGQQIARAVYGGVGSKK